MFVVTANEPGFVRVSRTGQTAGIRMSLADFIIGIARYATTHPKQH